MLIQAIILVVVLVGRDGSKIDEMRLKAAEAM